jgi:subtilisin-like proprotein convertase family protein
MVQRLFLSIFCFFTLICSVFSQLQVASASQLPYSPEVLVSNFMTGAGINVIDVTYNGDAIAAGYFKNGATSIGLDRGLILTTGLADTTGSLIGADSDGADFANHDNGNGAIEPNLEALSTVQLKDVAFYKITFQSYNDSIRFKYVFGSEEYPEFACSQYNDIFGFFIQGPGYPTPKNIAIIPGTNLPVSINNIHPINPVNTPCPAFNGQFYISNSSTYIPPTYDGYLTPFSAEASVIPCEIYTMIIAIADASDSMYDSGVFIEAGSFGSTNFITSSFGTGSNILPEQSIGNPLSLTFSQIPASILPITVKLSGSATNGLDYEAIDSVYTINSTDTVLQFTIQPILDSLEEMVENIVITATGGVCFVRSFDLFITDPGVIFKGKAMQPWIDGTPIIIGGSMSALPDTILTFYSTLDVPIKPVNTPVFSSINVLNLFTSAQEDIYTIESVCMNITHGWLDDLDIYLVAPSGKFIELTSDNGANGDNYTNTCFSPKATQSITFGMTFAPASSAPFTGTFQPEAPWSDLSGGDLNGTWKLIAIDDKNNFEGILNDWSISFSSNGEEQFKYQWSSGATSATIEVTSLGVYTVTVTNQASSFTKEYAVITPCGLSTQSYSICPNDSITINNEVFHAGNPSGYQIIPISTSCDSVVVIKLQFLPQIQTTTNTTICAGDTYLFGNQVLNTSGTYQATFAAAINCDSLHVLHLTVLAPNTTTEDISICQGSNYVFGNQILTTAGTYQQLFNDTNGCDSIHVLHLTVLAPNTTTEDISICQGSTYILGNQALTTAGTYQQLFKDTNGCDSTHVLNLSIAPPISDSLQFVIAINETVTVGGTVLSQPGYYTITLSDANGCDSILFVRIDLISSTELLHLRETQVTVQPNPSSNEVLLQWTDQVFFDNLNVFRVDQRLIFSKQISAAERNLKIDISTWKSGIYIVQLESSNGIVVRKMVKI